MFMKTMQSTAFLECCTIIYFVFILNYMNIHLELGSHKGELFISKSVHYLVSFEKSVLLRFK